MARMTSAKTVETIKVEFESKEIESIIIEAARKEIKNKDASSVYKYTYVSIDKDGYGSFVIRFLKDENK